MYIYIMFFQDCRYISHKINLSLSLLPRLHYKHLYHGFLKGFSIFGSQSLSSLRCFGVVQFISSFDIDLLSKFFNDF